MAPPVAVYVVAAVVGVAALFAFKEFVYEPHLAPKIEAWAEDFLERRRAARNRRPSAVPVGSRRHRESISSSGSSHHGDNDQADLGERNRERGANELPIDEFELEALAAREVDEWRNEVLRSQGLPRDGLRRRRLDLPKDDFDGFDSTTLDESFTSLTHTPLAYVISNISSPVTSGTVSLPQTPSRHHRSESQSTKTQMDSNTGLDRSFTVHETPAVPQGQEDLTPRRPTDSAVHPDISFPSQIAIPGAVSPATEAVPRPLPFTPTYQIMADDSPFGPLLPDTPRSSAEMYGERPFSPITRVMGSSSTSVSVSGSTGTRSSRTDSMSSLRTIGGSGVLRRRSGLVNQVAVNGADDGSDEENYPPISASNFRPVNWVPGTNDSVISSLSERYPAPPTPPVVVSPPSSIGVISAPSSPNSDGSEVVVHADGFISSPRSPPRPLSPTHPPLPLLQLPSSSASSGQISRSRSQAHSAVSPASYASFLSPLPLSHAASDSEADEFLSVVSDDSEWNDSPIMPGGSEHVGPFQDRTNNPFLDFEVLARDVRGNGSERDGSEVHVPDVGQEGGSEVGSDESWGSARRH